MYPEFKITVPGVIFLKTTIKLFVGWFKIAIDHYDSMKDNIAALKSSLIKQKGESQNGGNKKTKYAKFSKKNERLLPPDMHTCVCVSGGKKC